MGWLVGGWVSWLVGWLVWLVGGLVGGLGWLVGWLVGLVGWLVRLGWVGLGWVGLFGYHFLKSELDFRQCENIIASLQYKIY
jgi:hypothetical protein